MSNKCGDVRLPVVRKVLIGQTINDFLFNVNLTILMDVFVFIFVFFGIKYIH